MEGYIGREYVTLSVPGIETNEMTLAQLVTLVCALAVMVAALVAYG